MKDFFFEDRNAELSLSKLDSPQSSKKLDMDKNFFSLIFEAKLHSKFNQITYTIPG